ncbi:MAG: class I SAM-dependent RNA methyltransferase [Gemmatimonadota bacterium]
MSNPAPLESYVVTIPGLEAVTTAELAELGIGVDATEPGGLSIRASLADLYRVNLWLRTASRVTVRAARFHARNFAELERRAKQVDWAPFVGQGREVHFRVSCRKSKLMHEKAVVERLFDTMKAKIRGVRLVAKLADEDPSAVQRFVVRVYRDECWISADTSGDLLHRRGYRLESTKAPLRETLAAAMLLGAGWRGERPLVDPMCGSGTIVIEAAQLARRIPPGLYRSFALQRWPIASGVPFEALRDAAREGIAARPLVAIRGSDRDAGAIAAATANAERAGVTGDIELTKAPISDLATEEAEGLVLTNPPYGARVGERKALRNLYAQLGNTLRKRAAGWDLGLLSADAMLEAQTRIPLAERYAVSNGGIRVRLVLGSVPRAGA